MKRGAALGAAVAVSIGAGAGVLLSRTSAPAAASVPLVAGTTVRQLPKEWLQRPARGPSERKSEPEGARLTSSCGARSARLVRWRVSVDDGLDIGVREFARRVRTILCDERGWTSGGRVRFRYDPRAPRLIALRTGPATERRCLRLTGLRVFGFSCAGAREAVLNADRWFEGSPTLRLTVARYRALMVNHEIGHLLGLGHRRCAGGRAPVMMQQSKGLGGCRANPWPLPWEIRGV